MYTAKQVALAKKIEPALEATVFTMDVRAMGKGYEAYLAGVQGLAGVRYVRAMPSALYQQQQSRDLRLSYVGGDGKLCEEAFELVVLAVGLAPPAGMAALAGRLGVALNGYGFAPGDGDHGAHTARPGVFVAGAFREPKDIPETVVEAAAAVAQVAAFLGPGRAAEAQKPAWPALRDVADEQARIGVFACACDGELAGLELPALLDWAQGLPGVAWVQAVAAGCTADGQAGCGGD
jgi:heterodisulfide reductase subunit A-like polyferredoxin